MKWIILFSLLSFSAIAHESCFQIGYVCKAKTFLSKDYIGTSGYEPSQLLAEEGARKACRRSLEVAYTSLPKWYCDGSTLDITCEEISFEDCKGKRHVCKAVHWNGGDYLGIGSLKLSKFMAEASAVEACRKTHKTPDYISEYCEVHSDFKCEEVSVHQD